MTTPDQILTDLLITDATADALSERIRIPMLAIKAMCQRHAIDGLVRPIPIAGGNLTAWRLTPAGREVANALSAYGETVAAIKDAFPGATIKTPSPIAAELDDEIPY